MRQTPFNTALFAAIIRERPVALAVSGFALAHEALLLAGLRGWPCPVLHFVGIPCPTCGLSRAIGALVRGDWATMFSFHAFAPLFTIALIVIICAAMLPERLRRTLTRLVETLERRSGITAWLLLALIAYWAVRLAGDSSAFIQLMQS